MAPRSVLVHPDSPLSVVSDGSEAHRLLADVCAGLPARAQPKVPLRHGLLDWVCCPVEARVAWGLPDSEAAWRKRWSAGDAQNSRKWRKDFPVEVVELRSAELEALWSDESTVRQERLLEESGGSGEGVSLGSMSEQELVLVIVRQLLLRSAEGDSDALKDLKSWSTLVTQLANDAIKQSDQDLSGMDGPALVDMVLDSSMPLVLAGLRGRGFEVVAP